MAGKLPAVRAISDLGDTIARRWRAELGSARTPFGRGPHRLRFAKPSTTGPVLQRVRSAAGGALSRTRVLHRGVVLVRFDDVDSPALVLRRVCRARREQRPFDVRIRAARAGESTS